MSKNLLEISIIIIIMPQQFLRSLNTVTDSRALYKAILKIQCMQQW